VYRDNFYGTLKSEVERIWALGKNVILILTLLEDYVLNLNSQRKTLAVFRSHLALTNLKTIKRKIDRKWWQNQYAYRQSPVELATAPQFDVMYHDLPVALEEAYQLVKDFASK
jgi:guanylate kinase